MANEAAGARRKSWTASSISSMAPLSSWRRSARVIWKVPEAGSVSFLLQGGTFPKRAFVKGGWQREEAFANQIKKDPGCQQAGEKLAGAKQADKAPAL